jgi:hypothetical protein
MKEALKLALEALETERDIYREHDEDGAPEYILEAITAINAALAQPTSGDYALGYAEGFNDACKPAHVISEQEQLKQRIATTNYYRAKREYEPDAAQPAQEPWCIKMNGCTTKCEDCPDEPAQKPVAWLDEEEKIIYWHNTHETDDYHGFRRTTPLKLCV